MTVPTEAQMARSRRITLLACALLVVAGSALAMTTDGTAEIAGGFLVGVAVIIVSGRVFYEIGIGEDRDRERGRT